MYYQGIIRKGNKLERKMKMRQAKKLTGSSAPRTYQNPRK